MNDNALDLLMDFNREIKIYKTEEEMKQTSEKFLKLGNPIGIVQDGKLIAYFNLYCNNYETLEAYILEDEKHFSIVSMWEV